MVAGFIFYQVPSGLPPGAPAPMQLTGVLFLVMPALFLLGHRLQGCIDRPVRRLEERWGRDDRPERTAERAH